MDIPTDTRGPRTAARTAALCGGYFLVLLDVTVVNVTLPSIGSALHMHGAGLAWVVDAYTVPLAALLLAAGALGDRLGHRPIVLAGFAGFGAASVLCALAPSAPVLVGGRALQGASAALLLPGTLALLTAAAPDDRTRTRTVGLWAAAGGAALPAGPLAGGLLTALAGWRAVFWLNVPLIAAALAVLAALPSPEAAHPRPARTGEAPAGKAGAPTRAAAEEPPAAAP
ncbi:MAG: MFS transporter, partial [Streptomyces sp.]|nr:MFS transporter [Streptomyces sp.]